jgi:hypothetical protein
VVRKREGRRIALGWICENVAAPPGETIVVDDSLTRDEDFGWVFFYNSNRYLQTRDSRHQLLGNAPIIVERTAGTVHVTGTAKPIDEYIDEFRARSEPEK